MPSPSAPSGVIGELTARPNKRRRTEAFAVHSEPGSGAILGQNGTSMPFASCAMPYDDLPPNNHVHHPTRGRADAPEPQWTPAHQSAFEDVAVHEELQAPVDWPSTPCDGPSTFAQLSGEIRSGTGQSKFHTPYPADRELIAQFVDIAKKVRAKLDNTKAYAYLLIRFSEWLRQQNKAGLQDRLGQGEDALREDACDFQKGAQRPRLAAALTQLLKVASPTDGTVKIRSYSHHVAADGDTEELIKSAFSDNPAYARALRAFSAWLHTQDKEGFSETHRLQSQTLMDEAKAFAKARMAGSQKSVAALKQLRIFKLTGKTALAKRCGTFDVPEADRQLSEKFKSDFLASCRENEYVNPKKFVDNMSFFLMQFSAWLKKKKKEKIASRLHDETLNDDLRLYSNEKSADYKNKTIGMLNHLRKIFPPNMQLPDLRSIGESAEPSYSSYSSMFPLTPEGGWPQAAEGDWIPDMPEEDVMGPASSAQPEASSYNISFDWEAPYQEATEPQHTTAMSQASILSFDQKDTGPS
ncbi:hypothetical protein [Xanthomonas fragariae]